MALEADADLHVVSAYAAPVSGFHRSPDAEVSQTVLAEVQDALPAQLRRILPAANPPTSAEVSFGSPVEVILQRAAAIHADLIVLGTHRGTDVHAQFLGTTADAVLRSAVVPCLAVRGSPNLPLRRVAVAVNFSDVDTVALELGLAWATWLNGKSGTDSRDPVEVRAAHVIVPTERDTSDTAAKRLTELLNRVGRKRAGDQMLRGEVLEDLDPAIALARWADRIAADLLVIGTRSRSGLQGAHLGSISSALARHAPCPVLLVPPAMSGKA